MDREYVERLLGRVADLETQLSAVTEENIWLRERMRVIGTLTDIGYDGPPKVNKRKVVEGKQTRGGSLVQEGELKGKDAAAYIGKEVHFLQNDRLRKTPRIPFEKRGAKTIVYKVHDLDAFLRENDN